MDATSGEPQPPGVPQLTEMSLGCPTRNEVRAASLHIPNGALSPNHFSVVHIVIGDPSCSHPLHQLPGVPLGWVVILALIQSAVHLLGRKNGSTKRDYTCSPFTSKAKQQQHSTCSSINVKPFQWRLWKLEYFNCLTFVCIAVAILAQGSRAS
eukprot:2093619-Amphidinium_carterae.1